MNDGINASVSPLIDTMHILFATITLIGFSSLVAANSKSKHPSPEKNRLSKASKVVNSDIIALYVKGFVCESCGIGMKKKSVFPAILPTSKLRYEPLNSSALKRSQRAVQVRNEVAHRTGVISA